MCREIHQKKPSRTHQLSQAPVPANPKVEVVVEGTEGRSPGSWIRIVWCESMSSEERCWLTFGSCIWMVLGTSSPERKVNRILRVSSASHVKFSEHLFYKLWQFMNLFIHLLLTGISLNQEQYRKLKEAIPKIDEALKNK